MWNRWFFDALERKDGATASLALLAFLALAAAMTAASVGIVLSRETVQVRWREWLTHRLVDTWLAKQRFYRLQVGGLGITNPEYRIADDIRWATEPIVDFAIGILGAVVSLVTFVGILWSVGGGLTVGGVAIPAYMVICACLHGVIVTTLMLYCGRAMPRRMAARNEAEAQFRFSLMRLRENAETVALARGADSQRQGLGVSFDAVVHRWMKVVRLDGQLTWILTGNGVLLPVIPILLATPKYLSGELTLGAVMQLATAYGPVTAAIAWANDNFRAIANWHASARRVVALTDAMQSLDAELEEDGRRGIAVEPSPDARIRLDDVTVASRQGDTLVAPLRLAVEPGEALLITGESGAGKSVLVRAIAGLWPWGAGHVRLPRDAAISFVPQRVFLPHAALREALCYPAGGRSFNDAVMICALERTGLAHLAARLDEVARWDQLLSAGERQRFAFARLLAQRPDIVLLDEALSALDDEAQVELMALLHAELPEATLISVAQRDGLAAAHDRVLVLHRGPGGARLGPAAVAKSKRAAVSG
jgi:putative ATP-binding cassette transporter